MHALTFLILLCVSVDFSNPLLPGSVRLEPGESVDGVCADRPRAELATIRDPTPTPLHGLAVAAVRAPSASWGGIRYRQHRLFRALRPYAEPDAPPSPSGDH